MLLLKSETEIEALAESNRLVAEVMRGVQSRIEIGAIPIEIDQWVEKEIRTRGATPAFKGYRGFPASVCFSVNERVVHGIPDRNPLKPGDVCSIDIGVCYNDFYGDMARSFPVGKVGPEVKKILETAQESLDAGIEQFQVGNRLHDISAAVQKVADREGYGIVREFVGHGIGRSLHEDPQVPNFGRSGTGPRLRVGLALAIEPMLNLGTHEVEVLQDGWTVVTRDRKLSIHVEDTVVLTEEGPRILTRFED
ncbi:MAG: type I methionyl aminopeptidase [Candidatus Omnitrophica bacterium]|nr:type I methionyl aminopeptidase [Candidatus Omnitrophota bacterium]MCA9435641.1 type I methionyl aminopeptidase [Candidatus Omnitrophota bacterium]MCA9445687.1 type I methionyl aminopeptidase [Candidatus Omnitrophota bacterium]